MGHAKQIILHYLEKYLESATMIQRLAILFVLRFRCMFGAAAQKLEQLSRSIEIGIKSLQSLQHTQSIRVQPNRNRGSFIYTYVFFLLVGPKSRSTSMCAAQYTSTHVLRVSFRS
jgi:hypothetical protein